MHAFILGVPDAYRGAQLEEQLSAQRISFDVVPGVDARSWTAEDLTRVYSARASQLARHRQLAPTEVAAALGHQRLVKALLARGDRWGLLLEDDARLIRSLDPVLEAVDRLPHAPIVVQLGSHHPAISDGPPERIDGDRLWRQPRPVFGAYAYLMNRRAAEIADRAYRRRRIDSVADWPTGWSGRVQFWRPARDVARPDAATPSLIDADRRALRAAPPRSRPVISDAAIGVLQVIGVATVYGRWHGLPMMGLYRRDRIEGIQRMRRLGLSLPARWSGAR